MTPRSCVQYLGPIFTEERRDVLAAVRHPRRIPRDRPDWRAWLKLVHAVPRAQTRAALRYCALHCDVFRSCDQ